MPARLASIVAFRLIAADPARLARFYAAIGFAVDEPALIRPDELRMLGLAGGGTRTPMRLGGMRVDLDAYERAGRPYPAAAGATDAIFQHLALVTEDADAAWARAAAAGAAPISRSGPTTLPASSGRVRAIKFRDPEGHPLEFIQFPDARTVRRIDHSAIVVADIARSIDFYTRHGLRRDTTTHNRGAAQDDLDGADDVDADVVAMVPDVAAPHVELLGYRRPRPLVADPPGVADVAATRIVWAAEADALLRDPDGHLHQLVAGST